MLCSFKELIYPKNISLAQAGEYTVAIYTLKENMLDAQNNRIYEAKVVGHFLPLVKNVCVNMTGEWKKHATHGVQFVMSSYAEVVEPTQQGIVAYLASGLIKGIGPKMAASIYDAFGADTLRVLDKNPEELLQIKGISKTKLKRILDSYIESRGARDIVTFLAPYGVTAKRAVSIYKHFGADAINIVKRHPYRLCEMWGVGFTTADSIALNMGLSLTSSERIDAGLLYTLQKAESEGGHLCLPRYSVLSGCAELLKTPEISEATIEVEIDKLIIERKLEQYCDQIFRGVTAGAEKRVAIQICQFLTSGSIKYRGDLDADIAEEQKKMGVIFASEQRQAIKTALTSPICIITGGPGTGKTLIQRALLGIYTKRHSDANIICCAPTGRAARRMAQCTGYPASTMHKALGLMAEEDAGLTDPEPIEVDMLLVDEISMSDIYLTKHLLCALPLDCQIVLIGDADQLPSVGPGAVLSELIACELIPTVKLDRVYRQEAGSRIAINAKLIRHNNVSLQYGGDFHYIESANLDHSADLIERLYLEEIDCFGIDNVALLTPFRHRTATGVNALNERLREKINPPSPLKPEAIIGRRVFRQGDKIMCNKNMKDISNGDIGYITGITHGEDSVTVHTDFGDGRGAGLDLSELDCLDLAYANTVHKSQGSEYSSVIINIQNAHRVMLKRPLIYTAITRAKERVLIVGDRKAICSAITTPDAEKRGTMLANRITELCEPQIKNTILRRIIMANISMLDQYKKMYEDIVATMTGAAHTLPVPQTVRASRLVGDPASPSCRSSASTSATSRLAS